MNIAIDGARFEYFKNGKGEPLIMVHGSASDYRTWYSQLDTFAELFTTILYSRRYHWPNEPIPEGADYSMNEHVDDLLRILCSLDATPAHLVGHSYGAFVCLLLALRKPHLVRTLVLAEPPVITLFVSNNPKLMEIFKVLVTRPRTAAALIKFGVHGVAPARKAFRQGDVEAGIQRFGDAVFGHGGYGRLSEFQKAQVHDNVMTVKAELLGTGFPSLDSEQLGNLKVPTLLVTGQRSIDLFYCLTDRLQELMPYTERVEISGASHMMHEDNATAYNSAILSFLSKSTK